MIGKEDFYYVGALLTSIWVMCGAVIGACNHADAKDGCAPYRSYAAYSNPGYVGMCEFLRPRFNRKPE